MCNNTIIAQTFHHNTLDMQAINRAVHANHFRVHADSAAHLLHFLGNRFPELARAKFRVEELPDKASLSILLAYVRPFGTRLFLASKDLLHSMNDSLGD